MMMVVAAGAVAVAVRNCRILLDCRGFGWCWSGGFQGRLGAFEGPAG